MKNKILYISIAVGLSVIFFLLGWFLHQSTHIPALTANSKVEKSETARLYKDWPELKIIANTYSTNTNFVFLDEKGNVATTLSVSNINIEPPSYRIVKGNTHDWFVVTRIESSGTGLMNRIDEWYTMLQDGTMAKVLSYPSNGLEVPDNAGQNKYWRTDISNESYKDDSAVDIKLTTKICDKDDKNCSESSQTTHYVWDNEYEEFLAEIAGTNVVTYEKGTTYEEPVLDEYEKYVSGLRAVCPFESTASTADCLDAEIAKQKQQYDSLSKKLITFAKDGIKGGKLDIDGVVPMLFDAILTEIPAYNKVRDNNIWQLCGIKNIMTTGSGIVIDSRKCFMYYNAKDIQMLESIVGD